MPAISLYLPQAIQCPERIHCEKNVNHNFNNLIWKEKWKANYKVRLHLCFQISALTYSTYSKS
jgi:hypothetical protein